MTKTHKDTFLTCSSNQFAIRSSYINIGDKLISLSSYFFPLCSQLVLIAVNVNLHLDVNKTVKKLCPVYLPKFPLLIENNTPKIS